MKQLQHELRIPCRGRGFYELTDQIRTWVQGSGIQTGMLHLFVRHTSCSLLIQENADPTVLLDMETFMSRLVPDGDPSFRHRSEGPDDMAAHVRMALGQVCLSIPVTGGKPALGTWQGVFLFEHREEHFTRHVILHCTGE